MKIVQVTDGSEFIGSNLANELAKIGNDIIINNLSTSRIENIQNLIEKDNVKFVKGSIIDLKLLNETFDDVNCIFHRSAILCVPRSVVIITVIHEEKSKDFIIKLSERSI